VLRSRRALAQRRFAGTTLCLFRARPSSLNWADGIGGRANLSQRSGFKRGSARKVCTARSMKPRTFQRRAPAFTLHHVHRRRRDLEGGEQHPQRAGQSNHRRDGGGDCRVGCQAQLTWLGRTDAQNLFLAGEPFATEPMDSVRTRPDDMSKKCESQWPGRNHTTRRAPCRASPMPSAKGTASLANHLGRNRV
jgi:hypothetical protein